jgi:isopentenyl-diphosphate delta-isomerase
VGDSSVPQISERKSDHLRINLDRDVTAKGIDNGFDSYRFVHRALPEIDLREVDTSLELFGKRLSAPILISCMTGGTPEARKINRSLAYVAEERGIAIGVGSGRALLEHPELLDSFDVRPVAPNALLFANLGAVQLNKGYGTAECRRLVDALRADALVLHLNPLQEALQPEGDTVFRGLGARIAQVCRELEVPVIVKEVGWGITAHEVRSLFDGGAAAVDVAGAGGTSWSEVERHRLGQTWRANVAATFAGWGIPTAEALCDARRLSPEGLIFASGGVRNGLDAAKAMALGANLVGVAAPFLRAAAQSTGDAMATALQFAEEIRIVMFLIGARTLDELRGTKDLTRLVNI